MCTLSSAIKYVKPLFRQCNAIFIESTVLNSYGVSVKVKMNCAYRLHDRFTIEWKIYTYLLKHCGSGTGLHFLLSSQDTKFVPGKRSNFSKHL